MLSPLPRSVLEVGKPPVMPVPTRHRTRPLPIPKTSPLGRAWLDDRGPISAADENGPKIPYPPSGVPRFTPAFSSPAGDTFPRPPSLSNVLNLSALDRTRMPSLVEESGASDENIDFDALWAWPSNTPKLGSPLTGIDRGPEFGHDTHGNKRVGSSDADWIQRTGPLDVHLRLPDITTSSTMHFGVTASNPHKVGSSMLAPESGNEQAMKLQQMAMAQQRATIQRRAQMAAQQGVQMLPHNMQQMQQMAMSKARQHIQQEGVPHGQNQQHYQQALAHKFLAQIQQNQAQQAQVMATMSPQTPHVAHAGMPNQAVPDQGALRKVLGIENSAYTPNQLPLPGLEETLASDLETNESNPDESSQFPQMNYTRTGRIYKTKSTSKVHSCHCGRSFAQLEHLRRHQRSHAQNAWICEFPECGKKFYRPDILQRHQEGHQSAEKSTLAELMTQHGGPPMPESLAPLAYGKPTIARYEQKTRFPSWGPRMEFATDAGAEKIVNTNQQSGLNESDALEGHREIRIRHHGKSNPGRPRKFVQSTISKDDTIDKKSRLRASYVALECRNPAFGKNHHERKYREVDIIAEDRWPDLERRSDQDKVDTTRDSPPSIRSSNVADAF